MFHIGKRKNSERYGFWNRGLKVALQNVNLPDPHFAGLVGYLIFLHHDNSRRRLSLSKTREHLHL